MVRALDTRYTSSYESCPDALPPLNKFDSGFLSLSLTPLSLSHQVCLSSSLAHPGKVSRIDMIPPARLTTAHLIFSLYPSEFTNFATPGDCPDISQAGPPLFYTI